MMPAARKTPAPRLRFAHLPAPVGGMNSVSPGTDMPVTDSIFAWNLITVDNGIGSRRGYREWVTGLDGDPRSELPFTGSVKDGSTNRLFVCTVSGIWDCSQQTTTPTQVVTFPVQSADSGYGSSAAFTDLNGNHWLAYCDEENGYYVYAESGATWTKVTYGSGAGQVTEQTGGPNTYPTLVPGNLCYVCAYQNRLWFVEKNTQRAWYLGIQAITGGGTAGAVPFYFGSRFVSGGDLRCLTTWSYDGGSGPQDRLVAVSGGGDVVIYQGIDPSSASTFSIVSYWQIGAVPLGRRLTSNIGADVLVMSTTGLLALSTLSMGDPIIDRKQYATYKIQNIFQTLLSQTTNMRGWSLRIHPLESVLMVISPAASTQGMLVMSLTTRAWSQYRGLPIGICGEAWNGSFYFGSGDGSGRVLVNDGDLDGVTIANPNAFTPIDCSLLTGFSNAGSPLMKRIQQVTVRAISKTGSIPLNAEARFGFDYSEAASPIGAGPMTPGTWNNAAWGPGAGAGIWGGAYAPQRYVFGAVGMGAEAAVAIRFSTTSRTVLVGFDIAFEMGGFR